MRMTALTLTPLMTVFVCALHADPAQAQPARVFVAAQGSDANPCSFALPCRTFQHAHDVVGANGEIDVLDPAGYGAVTITKSISIQGHGFAGLATAAGAIGVTVNAGASDVVNLNGLLIDGVGIGSDGIVFNTGQSLTIEGCIVRGFESGGIAFLPTASSSLAASNTQLANNGASGILVSPSGSGAVTAVLNRVEAVNSGNAGILVRGTNSTGTINVGVSESVSAGNGGAGFSAVTSSGHAPITLMVFHSFAAHNDTGLVAQGTGAVLNLAQSMVTGNANGWQIFISGAVQSYGDNYIDGNVANQAAPPVLVRK